MKTQRSQKFKKKFLIKKKISTPETNIINQLYFNYNKKNYVDVYLLKLKRIP